MQKPDFRHYDQRSEYLAETHRALLWVPRRNPQEEQSASRYAAKQLSDICRNKSSVQSAKFST